jgi:hypothetical protein
MMKVLVTVATALAVVVGLASVADAGPRKKKKVYHSQHYSKYYRPSGDYYEQRLEAQRFGSQRWWDVYMRQRPRGG